MRFFVGIHQPCNMHRVDFAMLSVNRLVQRKGPFSARQWIMDSGAFSQISTHGRFLLSTSAYAEQIERWATCGRMLAAVSQDYMCEPSIREITGRSVEEHQWMTIDRYDMLMMQTDHPIMPVLQGWVPEDYAQHARDYGDRLVRGMWVGVGSVCKRNAQPGSVAAILAEILTVRPDLRLHGFGLKVTALHEGAVRDRLHSADSMAWSFAARKQGRNGNCITEAQSFARRISAMPVQMSIL